MTDTDRQLAVLSQALEAAEQTAVRAKSDSEVSATEVARARLSELEALRRLNDAEAEVDALKKLVEAPPAPDARMVEMRRSLLAANARLAESESETEHVMLYARDLEKNLQSMADLLWDKTKSEFRPNAYRAMSNRTEAIKERAKKNP